MAYTKTTWVNGQTPINETNLNHIEDGIYTVDQAVSSMNVPEVKTTTTTSNTAVYSCTYTNTQLGNKLNTSAVKTSNTSSNNDTYSCTYVNTQLGNKLNTSAVKTSATTSNSDTYSCTYINNAVLEKYSTTETKIGTWTDGKPVYRRVITKTLDLSSAGAHTVSTGISNVKKMIKIDYIIDGYYEVVHNSAITAFGMQSNTKELYLYTNVNWDSAIAFTFIIEYTKTTD